MCNLHETAPVYLDKPHAPGKAIFVKETGSLRICCASHSYIAVPFVKQQDRSLVPAKEWWNGIRPEWKDDEGAIMFR